MSEHDGLERVRQALGHRETVPTPPSPPAISDSITRLVSGDADLAGVFSKHAKEQKMLLSRASANDVTASIIEFLRSQPIRRVALSISPLFERFGLFDAVKQAGFDVKRWDEITLDAMYDYDCAVTDVHCAVAENATLVIKPSPNQGRSMSLVPMFHVAVVESSQIIPDMIDLFEQMVRDEDRSNFILITGPSKTADIEMTVVTGVHGPNVVKVFLID